MPRINSLEDVVPDDEKEVQYDTSEPAEVNKAKKRNARTRADRLKFVQAAMQHPEGRAWFNDLLVKCKVFNISFTEDPYRTAFNCGMNNIGLMVLADIQETSAKEYVLMVNESNARKG